MEPRVPRSNSSNARRPSLNQTSPSINNNARQSLVSYLDDEEQDIIEEDNQNNQNQANVDGGANFIERV
jgi:hypothetical protein